MPGEDHANPYASPSTSHVETRRRTRWRVIPATLLFIYGLIGVLVSPIMFTVECRRPVEYGGGMSAALVLGVGLYFGSSVLWIATAVLCWRGKWRWMILAFFVALAAASVGQYILGELGLD